MAYYPDWAENVIPPEDIDFSRFDWIDFAFAVPDENFALTWDDPVVAPSLLQRLVNQIHEYGKKVKISVGGWTGSKFFSSAVATPGNRQRFAQNIVQLFQNFNLDGVDIDWEYPGRPGNRGNQVDTGDSTNFLLFLQLLRTLLPPTARISAAVVSEPFVDSNGQVMNNMTDFADVLDWILLMNYDTWGSSREPGPNAPMYDACKNSTQPNASAAGAFKIWTASGFPASKLVLGLPTYGYISSSSADDLRTRSENYSREVGSVVKIINSDGDSEGQVLFRELVEQGALVYTTEQQAGIASFIGSGGFERRWDECSNTPFLRSTSANQIITYDDPSSLHMKAQFVKEMGMKGVNFFDIHGDTNGWDLTDAVTNGLS
ncbi:hypothetical protein APHAL10511_001943 [Amanita phalloides]|nr:hypothetical protein APHAL10511_001943 [Amanita phalloides]